MNGDMVIVRDFEGKPLVRRVWDSNNEKVYVCTDETYRLLLQGNAERWSVGFPREYVYFYDVHALAGLKSNSQQAWQRLKVWKETGGKKINSPM